MDKWVKLIDIVAKFAGDRKSKLTRETIIEDDLGVTGDDATDLFQLIVNEFQVDCTGLDLGKYFCEEGFDPIGLSILIRKLMGIPIPKRVEHDLTLGDIEDWIERGYWVDP